MSDDQDGCEWVSVSTRVVPDQRPLNGCMCLSVCSQASCSHRQLPYWEKDILKIAISQQRLDRSSRNLAQ